MLDIGKKKKASPDSIRVGVVTTEYWLKLIRVFRTEYGYGVRNKWLTPFSARLKIRLVTKPGRGQNLKNVRMVRYFCQDRFVIKIKANQSIRPDRTYDFFTQSEKTCPQILPFPSRYRTTAKIGGCQCLVMQENISA